MHQDEVRKIADRIYYPFAESDWVYTRNLGGLKKIRYASDTTGYFRFDRRIKRAFKHLFCKHPSCMRRGHGVKSALLHRWYGFLISAQLKNNRPDGLLNSNPIFWEEDADYMIMFRPPVGEKIKEFLLQDPTNPYAIGIAEEMKRALDEGYIDGI